MATIKVVPHSLDVLVQSMRTAATEIQNHIDDLRNTAAWLETEWTGDAADAYQESQRAWIDDATSLRWSFSELANAIAEIRLRYVNTETEVVEKCS